MGSETIDWGIKLNYTRPNIPCRAFSSMARLPRFILPGCPQHVIQRGNNRQAIFCTGRDYQYYLEKLELAASEHDCSIHAYVQKTNHVHLLVSPNEPDGLSKMMQSLGRNYVQYFNHHYKRTGTLWEGRYKSTLIRIGPVFIFLYALY